MFLNSVACLMFNPLDAASCSVSCSIHWTLPIGSSSGSPHPIMIMIINFLIIRRCSACIRTLSAVSLLAFVTGTWRGKLRRCCSSSGCKVPLQASSFTAGKKMVSKPWTSHPVGCVTAPSATATQCAAAPFRISTPGSASCEKARGTCHQVCVSTNYSNACCMYGSTTASALSLCNPSCPHSQNGSLSSSGEAAAAARLV